MKRLLCIILAVIIGLSVMSCGEKPVQEEPIQHEQEQQTSEETADVETTPVFSEIIADGCFDPDYDYSANPSDVPRRFIEKTQLG